MVEAKYKEIGDVVAFAAQMAEKIAPNAKYYDQENKFALESITLLQRHGYAALTVPKEYGGVGANLYEFVQAQERLAMGDGAVALSIGMSMIKIIGQANNRTWPPALYDKIMRATVERGALVNSIASEPRLGSPSRGGKPETVAIPDDKGGWHITGHKTFGSLSPILDFIIVNATIKDGSDAVGRFMLERGEGKQATNGIRATNGIHIKETWNSMGMRATGSHDMILERAYAPRGSMLSCVETHDKRPKQPTHNVQKQSPYFALPVVSVYLGCAVQAHQAAVQYASKRVPIALGRPLTTIESIRDKFAENERELRMARMMLHDVARRVDASNGQIDDELMLDLYVAKHTAANNAISVADRAMRVVGGAALASGSVLERAYRNVRAGLLHPPADDVTSRVLAKWTIETYE